MNLTFVLKISVYVFVMYTSSLIFVSFKNFKKIQAEYCPEYLLVERKNVSVIFHNIDLQDFWGNSLLCDYFCRHYCFMCKCTIGNILNGSHLEVF